MNFINRKTRNWGIATLALLAATVMLAGLVVPAQAQTYTPLYSFGVVDSTQNGPHGQLALGRDGNFYGEVNEVRSEIYQITPGGAEVLLWEAPQSPALQQQCNSGLTLGSDGLLYGACHLWNDNVDNGGILFKYDPKTGQAGPTVLYSFPYCNYSSPTPGPLTLGLDGNLYGTTYGSGACNDTYGTFFSITPTGKYTALHVFQGWPGNDAGFPSGPLTLGSDGNFYGTSQFGGNTGQNGGTVFKVTPKGVVTLLYSFANGIEPSAGMTQGADGKFYGTTYYGGTYSEGTIFQLASKGNIKVLHNFNPSLDHAGFPNFPLTLGTDGAFYAPSLDFNMGGYGNESLFKITTTGAYEDLHDLLPAACPDGTPDGCMLASPLVLHPNGTFYGTTTQGGQAGRGVFYGLNTGLKPYIIPQFPRGSIGTALGILGTGFTGATGVAFNGVAAPYTVVSDTYLTATIPTGATTGYVTVGESSGTLKSATKFTVLGAKVIKPVITSLSPGNALAGGAGFTLTVNGTGFVSNSTVNWSGSARSTTFVSATKLMASIDASDIAKAGTYKITVANPPAQGGTSTAVNFAVTNPAPTLISIAPSSATHGGAALTLTATGTGYVAVSKIAWNGVNLATKYVSGTTLTATITAARIKTAGTASVTVVNPTPGGGTSGAKTFTIN